MMISQKQQDITYHVPQKNLPDLLKALNNKTRYEILVLLKDSPLSISEIARKLNISQPTITNYINMLEKAGLVSTRVQKSPKGLSKLCYLLYDEISFSIETLDQKNQPEIYSIELPVGHYTSFSSKQNSLLASQTRIIASSAEYSRFFHPIRMEAELLVISEGEVCYLFPHNIPEEHEVKSLQISMELNAAYPDQSPAIEVTLFINNHALEPFKLSYKKGIEESISLPDWYPEHLSKIGNLYVWEINDSGATLNNVPSSATSLKQLNLDYLQPIEMKIKVRSLSQEKGGLVIFGKAFGRYNRNISLDIVYHPD